MTKKKLVRKTKEAVKLLSLLNHAKVNNRALLDQAKAAKAAQNLAEEKAKLANDEAEVARADLAAAKAKAAGLEAKLQEALDSKEAKVKAVDEKAFEEGQAAVRGQYQQQVNLASSSAFLPELEDDTENDKADEVVEEATTDAKSPTLNEQIDLTQDEEDDLVSKGVSPIPTTSEAEVQCSKRSLDQTLLEINAEIATKKNAMLPTEADKTLSAEVEQSQTNPNA
ncbi:uncharacterized protein LOC114259236 [Camellia sinensis]|uniref:uncharacterized protein LOC114259236 n=1 Tax=Camellia sinensis TaxID=4442 RepID=UPI001035E648|nr:uncharacterized protein LOC114259236 [Camellia sinensis]